MTFESASELLLSFMSSAVTSEGKRRRPSLRSATKEHAFNKVRLVRRVEVEVVLDEDAPPGI